MAASPMPDIDAMETPNVPTDAAPGNVPGLILPPPDIRDLVEKTAPFVARNGPSFEERLREKGEFIYLKSHSYYYKRSDFHNSNPH